MTTGSRMKARRKETGVPVEDIASALGVSVATVYRYENGDIEKVPGAILEPLSKVLRTTPAYLMGWADSPDKKAPTPVSESGLSTEAKEIAKAYDQATGKEQSTVRFVLSDYLQDTAAPRELAARTSGEPIKDDPSTFIIEGEDPDIL
ncbi:MAG: helix-turn-helix domain-containing protein [Oscillospiraceae bacterium]|nr:helix-turn-helix domain-containing protein [Oscillospiraceae bacterium]